MTPDFLKCESHPGKLLTDHLVEVSARLDGPLLRLAGLCHDLGKASGHFQDSLDGRGPLAPALRHHALLSAEILLEVAGGLAAVDAALAYLFVRRHHGELDNLSDALEPLRPTEEEILAKQRARLDGAGLARWLSRMGLQIRPCGEPARARLRKEVIQALRARSTRNEQMRRFQKALGDFGRLLDADRVAASKQPAQRPFVGQEAAWSPVDLTGATPEEARKVLRAVKMMAFASLRETHGLAPASPKQYRALRVRT
ncbi:MAG: CRISPR-associated endonuclease Cas3'' [Acidobacteria bacterium]|nr:CRISPR-associated endonuclease Cas3'' [Acidobacteriota bacterium]